MRNDSGTWIQVLVALIALVGSVVTAYFGYRNRRDIQTEEDEPPIGELVSEVKEDLHDVKQDQRRTFLALLRHLLHHEKLDGGLDPSAMDIVDTLSKEEEERNGI